jgi:hypothetical protein
MVAPSEPLVSPMVSALVCWKVRPGRLATKLPRSRRLAAPPRNSELTACERGDRHTTGGGGGQLNRGGVRGCAQRDRHTEGGGRGVG